MTPAAPESASTIVFAGGGTAGHIVPALAIAEEIRATDPDSAAHFVCSTRPIDATVLADRPHTPIHARPFSLHPKRALSTLLNLVSTRSALKRTLRELNASVVVTTGGFVSAPAALAARSLSIPLVMLNLDAVPGKANRAIARFATVNLSTADTPDVPDSWTRITPIVRRDLDNALHPIDPETARGQLGLFPDRNTLLITGGSQGARSINQMLLTTLRAEGGTADAALADALAGSAIQVFHQAGPPSSPDDTTIGDLQSAYAARNIPAKVVGFEPAMHAAYAGATLALTRAGAGTVAELWNARTPAVLLPYPHHADNHPAHNARPLTDAGAAIGCDARVEPHANLESAGRALAELLTGPQTRAPLAAAARSLPPLKGRAEAAEAILGLISRSKPAQRG